MPAPGEVTLRPRLLLSLRQGSRQTVRTVSRHDAAVALIIQAEWEASPKSRMSVSSFTYTDIHLITVDPGRHRMVAVGGHVLSCYPGVRC